jgi:hypothetical protein
MGLLVGLGLLIFLSYRSGSVLLRASRFLRIGPDLHGRCRPISRAILPAVSPWRRIRQGHGGQRLERRTLDSLPHNGAVVGLLAVCGMTHRESYRDIVMVAIVSALLALAAVIVLGSIFGSF